MVIGGGRGSRPGRDRVSAADRGLHPAVRRARGLLGNPTPNLPDVPSAVPDLGQYANKYWRHPDQAHAAQVTRLDFHVGRALAELCSSGLADNAIVIFTGGNSPDGRRPPAFFDTSGPFIAWSPGAPSHAWRNDDSRPDRPLRPARHPRRLRRRPCSRRRPVTPPRTLRNGSLSEYDYLHRVVLGIPGPMPIGQVSAKSQVDGQQPRRARARIQNKVWS